MEQVYNENKAKKTSISDDNRLRSPVIQKQSISHQSLNNTSIVARVFFHTTATPIATTTTTTTTTTSTSTSTTTTTTTTTNTTPLGGFVPRTEKDALGAPPLTSLPV